MYIGLFFFSIHQQYTLFWISTGHKNYRDNQIGRWNRCCLWPRKYTKKLLVTNWEPPGLYTHLNQCVKLLRQLDANYHRKCQCKEKYISRLGHQNVGTYSGILVWKFHCLDNNRPIIWEKIDLLISKNFMRLKENSCYSVPSLGNLETYLYVNQSWCYKIFLIHNDLIFWGKRQNLLWLELITDATFLMYLIFFFQ